MIMYASLTAGISTIWVCMNWCGAVVTILCFAMRKKTSNLFVRAANAMRRCFIDFGVEIKLNVDSILNKDKETGYVQSHLVQGTIEYPCYRDERGEIKQQTGTIIYIKSALTDNTSVDIREYAKSNPEFPNQTTGDQFFDEAQFESYRKLGYNSIQKPEELGLELSRDIPKESGKVDLKALENAIKQGITKRITFKKLK